MFVDTGWLHAGANQSYRAGGRARDGADQLSRGPLSSGMFGEFASADVFHEAISSAHARHVRTLQTHHQMLIALGDNARQAGMEFTAMDERNATELQMWQCGTDT